LLPHHTTAFENIKKGIASEILLPNPDFQKTFRLYTDASDLHLGASLIQNHKPLESYSFFAMMQNDNPLETFSRESTQRNASIPRQKENFFQLWKRVKNISIFYWDTLSKSFADHRKNTLNGLKVSGCVFAGFYFWNNTAVQFQYFQA
jgi:RNase H-like domain found in reverse transcriptase